MRVSPSAFVIFVRLYRNSDDADLEGDCKREDVSEPCDRLIVAWVTTHRALVSIGPGSS